MNYLLLLLLIPLLYPFAARYIFPVKDISSDNDDYYWKSKFVIRKGITWKESFIMMAITSAVAIIFYYTGRYIETYDREVINGEVVKKYVETRHCYTNCGCCRNSYPCHCRTRCSGSGKSRSCYIVCDTCYAYSWEKYYHVDANISRYEINVIDPQGINTPPRYDRVKIGDPVTETTSCTNYVKGAAHSLFHKENLTTKYTAFPEYPIEVYDYYKIDRAISLDVNISNINYLNDKIADINKNIGFKKHGNVINVFANKVEPDYIYALQANWKGAKKNDIVILTHITNYPNYDWVQVFSWSKNELFNVQLRDGLNNHKVVDDKYFDIILHTSMKQFERKEMKEYEYLKYEIEPPTWIMWLTIIIIVGAMIFMTIKFKEDN